MMKCALRGSGARSATSLGGRFATAVTQFFISAVFFCLAYGVPQMSQKRRNFFSEPPSRHFNKPQLNRKPRSLINPQLPNPPHKNNGIYFYCSSYSRPPPPPRGV